MMMMMMMMMYQYSILPRILRPVLIYAVPMSTVKTLERKMSSHLRRWLVLQKSLSSITVYGRHNNVQLPLISLEEEFEDALTLGPVILYHAKAQMSPFFSPSVACTHIAPV